MNRYSRWLWAAAIVLAAGGLRLPDLGERPMHADEAILADKFATFLERGSYAYDPTEYHGPVLAYVSTVSAWVRARTTYATLNEATVRVVPAIAGVLLALSPLLLAGAVGETSAGLAGMIVAVSSACVFYSRYYIPEMLLAVFTAAMLISLWRVSLTGSILSWACVGASTALMVGTKETAAIAFAAALPFGWLVRRDVRWTFFAAFAAVLVILMDPLALLGSFAEYWRRGTGTSLHVHPPTYYLQLMFSEPVLILALPGLFFPARTSFLRFLKWFCVLLAVIYSAIPYKTPWCVVSLIFGLALLVRGPEGRRWVYVTYGAVLAACAVLAWDRAHSLVHPWAYAHTTTDVFRIRDAVLRYGTKTPIGIYTRENWWPLPWYLRGNPNVRWSREVVPQGAAAAVVLASPDMEPALQKKFYEGPPPGQRELYMNLFREPVYLRPQVEVRGYVRKSLWDKLE
ncbi:MAG TPA: glycosyltransferase family 39 protein [Bryobacteraceae bacterium]|nr:glycosyltransferase family 39 protein [Bryobacteraceae bacterium]